MGTRVAKGDLERKPGCDNVRSEPGLTAVRGRDRVQVRATIPFAADRDAALTWEDDHTGR